MENLNNVPSTGTFGNSINEVNHNFGLVKVAIDGLEGRTIRSKGLFPTVAALNAAYPSPIVGDYAYVGSGLPAEIYDCVTAGTWHDTGHTGGSETINLGDYSTTTQMNAAIDSGLQGQVGYAVCSTAGGTARKDVVVSGFKLLANGGALHIKMTTANTHASATMNISPTSTVVVANTKPLFYNGAQATANNTWEANEILSIYYDGTNYQASNSQGGGGKAEKVKYDNSQSGLVATNVQGAVDEVSKKVDEINDTLLEWGDLPLSGLAFRGIRKISGKWYWTQDGSPYAYTIPVNGGMKIKIVGNATNGSQYAFLTSNKRGSGYSSPAWATGYSSVISISADATIEVTAPANATYLYLTQKIGSTVYTPSALYQQVSVIANMQNDITQNANDIEDINTVINASLYKENDVAIVNNGYFAISLYQSSKWYWNPVYQNYSYLIPITAGKRYKIYANETNSSVYAFLTTTTRPSSTSQPSWATGYNAPITIAAGESIEVVAPENAACLYLHHIVSSLDYTPTRVTKFVELVTEIETIEQDVSDLSTASYPVDIDKCPYKQFAIKNINGTPYFEGHDYESFSYSINVVGIKKVTITGNSTNGSVYAFLTGDNRAAAEYKPPLWATGYSNTRSITAGDSVTVDVPANATLLYLHQIVNNVNYTPSSLFFQVGTPEGVAINVKSIENITSEMSELEWGRNKAFYDIDLTLGNLSQFNSNENWSVSSSGLTCINPSNTIYTKHISSMSQKKTRLRFTLSSDGYVALCWANTGSSNGSYFSVDAANGLMSIHNNYSGSTSTPPSILSSANVTIIDGREYILEAIKERHNNTLRLYDGLSGSKVAELIANQASASAKTGGHQIGNLGIACVSGTVYIKRLQVVFDYIKPLIAVFGDSITEGDKVMQGVTYGDLLKEYFGDDRVVTSGKSGDTSDGVTTRIRNEISVLKPKIVIVCIGTNGGLASYQAKNIIAIIKSAGAIPVMCVPPLGSTNIASIRTLLISTLGLTPIRFDIATAVNNDVSQGQNKNMFVSDGLHPTATGHRAMFDRIKIDVPQLFDY